MKKKLLFIKMALTLSYALSAQLTITPGGQFFVAGNMQLTLQNTNLVNNGVFSAGSSTTSFTGDASSFIGGSGAVRFFQLEVNKDGNNSVVLQKKINVSQRVLFVSGFLDLNGSDLDLETTGRLDFERNDSRVRGPNGGQVLFATNLNSPITANPGGLGLFITTNQNLGNVTIRRGHQSQVKDIGASATILRYFDIIPSNNTNLNATLGVNYFDGELNGFSETLLEFWESANNTNWTDIGFTTKEASNNFLDKSGISSFGQRFTLSAATTPLPVRFILFNTKCEGSKVLLIWKTAEERNSDRYEIESSTDGSHWTVIGTMPAAGNTGTEKSYSFTDNNPIHNALYRIAQYDLGGHINFTGILRSSCNTSDLFSLRPNPVHDRVFITISGAGESKATIKIFDSKGALVNMQRANILPGTNQLTVDMKSLANGTYSLTAEWNNGQTRKTVQIIKQ